MAERLKATDCKSVLSRVRRFEPYSAHGSFLVSNFKQSSSFGSPPRRIQRKGEMFFEFEVNKRE